jgi:hypothetical protein
MPDSSPKSRLDVEDLALHEGATVLLRSALSHLAGGDWCEVRGDSAEFAGQLWPGAERRGFAASQRKESPEYTGSNLRGLLLWFILRALKFARLPR